jgi:hypothetical protein
MVALVGVAGAGARDPVGKRRLVRRDMAAAADRVAGNSVQSRKGRRGMATRARRRRRDSLGTMRAMARRAPAGDRGVNTDRFALVARGARGGRLARVRVVAFLTTLMAWGCARLLLGVAGPARGRFGGGVGDGRSVTRGASLVSRVRRDPARLRRVTRDAERLFFERREGVRLVASFASDTSRMGTGIDSGDLGVTAGARRCDNPRIVGVGLMARNARTLFPVAHVDIGVTSDARRPGVAGRVRRVAAGAYGVCGRLLRAERGLLAVATHACGLASSDELVRLMTADARFVTGWRRPGGLHVARRARRECGDRGLVTSMAIEATRRTRVTGVFRRSLAMAARAVCDGDRGRLVDLVALGALERRMPDHGRALALGLGVTTDTRGLGKIRREGVA